MARDEYDAIVVGAGLVGSVAAVALADQGWRVLVLERRSEPQAPAKGDVRALVLSVSSERILRALGFWPNLATFAWPIKQVHIAERGAFGTLDLLSKDIEEDALGWSCPADVLLYEFNRVLANTDGVDVCWDSELESIEQTTDAVVAHVRGVEQNHDIRAGILIGADGSSSQVRKTDNFTIESLDYNQSAIVCELEAERSESHRAIEYFTENGPVAWIPVSRNRGVHVQCHSRTVAKELMTLSDSAYAERLQESFGFRLGRLSNLSARRSHELTAHRVKSLAQERILLIGNAANAVHPNAAQGLNLGLRDAFALGAASAGCGKHEYGLVIQRYLPLRLADHRQTFALCHGLAQVFTSKFMLARSSRRSLLRALAMLPSMRRRLTREAAGLPAFERLNAIQQAA